MTDEARGTVPNTADERGTCDGTSRDDVARGQQGPWLQPAGGIPRHIPEPIITQHGNEHSRVVVEGTRTDDNTRCSLVLIHEGGDTWGLYPHGFGKFGVRLACAEAVKAARAILDSAQ